MKNLEKQTLVERPSAKQEPPAEQEPSAEPNGGSGPGAGGTSGAGPGHQRWRFSSSWLPSVDKNLLVSKLYYFFFYAAFGSIYPLLGVYFKQLGLSASQSGTIIGFKMLVEFCAAPIWGAFSDKSKKAKWVLVLSLFSWLLFTEAIAFVHPEPAMCITQLAKDGLMTVNNETVPLKQLLKELNIIQPPFSSIGYKEADVYRTFIILLVIMIVGQFLGSPALTLADSATLSHLGRDRYSHYGKQRMYGALGWGLAMLGVGIIVDQAPPPNKDSCEEDGTENFIVGFGAYAVLISVSIVLATQFDFKYHSKDDAQLVDQYSEIYGNSVTTAPGRLSKEGGVGDAVQLEDMPAQSSARNRAVSTDSELSDSHSEKYGKVTVEWFGIIKLFLTPRYGFVLFLAGFFGFGLGLVFTFLYWHLEDLGGEPTLFGIAAVMDHTSEFLSFFLSHNLISTFGHFGVLCMCLVCNSLRFLYVSFLEEPWWILPSEIVQGLVHGLLWASLTSYIGHAVPQNLRSSAQGILQGIYWGLGFGSGAIIGGLIVNRYGTVFAFRSFGFSCLIVLAVFLLVILLTREKSPGSNTEAVKKYGSLQKEGESIDENEASKQSGYLHVLHSWMKLPWGQTAPPAAEPTAPSSGDQIPK